MKPSRTNTKSHTLLLSHANGRKSLTTEIDISLFFSEQQNHNRAIFLLPSVNSPSRSNNAFSTARLFNGISRPKAKEKRSWFFFLKKKKKEKKVLKYRWPQERRIRSWVNRWDWKRYYLIHNPRYYVK